MSLRLNLLKYYTLFKWFRISAIRGKAYLFLTVTLFRPLQLIYRCKPLFFFRTKRIGAPTRLVEQWIYPLSSDLLRYCQRISSFLTERLQIGLKGGSLVILIVCSILSAIEVSALLILNTELYYASHLYSSSVNLVYSWLSAI